MICNSKKIYFLFAFLFFSVFSISAGWALNYKELEYVSDIGSKYSSIQDVINDALEQIKDAETEFTMNVSIVDQIKNEISKKLAEIKKKEGDLTNLKKELAVLENKLKEAEKARIESAEKLSRAYYKLAWVYKQAGLVGDPVQIGTGNYYYEAKDYIAQDYLDIFTVSRKITRSDYSESFGKFWTSSLDSRIIRGREQDNSNLEALLLEQKANEEECFNMRKYLADNYSQPFPDEEKQEYNLKLEEIQKQLDELTEVKMQNYQIDELNKYTAYGYYSKKDNYYIGFDSIIFIDGEGNNVICQKQENKWIPINKHLAADFFIQAYEEGFEIVYKNGTRKIFDKYGILSKTINRVGEEVKYISENGKIKEIHNKTGEVFLIERNKENLIVSIKGSTSGIATFNYTKGLLSSTVNNQGISEGYKYDKEGYLTEIIQGNTSSIKIEYEYYKKQKKKVVSAVINQLGQKETFSYDFAKNTVNHKTISGNLETYYLDEDGATKAYENEAGVLREFQFNEDNNISAVFENNEWKYFSYDDNYNPVKVTFEDGVSTFTEYNEFGDISFQSDRDGFTNESIFDEKGNVIVTKFCDEIVSQMEYYPNGLIKELKECGGTYSFEYNAFGSMTKKTKTSSEGYSTTETWTYDSQNRKTGYKNGNDYFVTYTYDNNSITEICPDKKITYILDAFNRETERIETDLITGTTYSKKTWYDKAGYIIQIDLNGKKYIEYEYEIPEKVSAYKIYSLEDENKSFKRKFLFDGKRRVIGEEVSFVEAGKETQKESLYSIDYENNADGMVMNIKKGNLAGHKYFYNNKNQLVKIQRPTGLLEERTYTKNGKLDSIVTDKERIDYHYYNDGKVSVTRTSDNDTQSVSIYNPNKQLVYETDYEGNTYSRIYDSEGFLKKEIGPGFYTVYEYDNQGFKTSEKLYSFSGELCYECDYDYDFQNRCITKTEGKKYRSKLSYDTWGRIIETEDEKGKQQYEYDFLGNCVKITNENGDEKNYSYNITGNVSEIYINGILFEQFSYLPSGKISEFSEFGKTEAKCFYDEGGNLISQFDSMNNETISSFDLIGNVISEKAGNTFVEYSYSPEEKKVSFKTSLGNTYSNKFDGNNNVIWEQDSFGNTAEYSFDGNNRLVTKRDFENRITSYTYDSNNNTSRTWFENGETCLVEKDPLGHIVKIENDEGSILFEYDTGGKLVKMKDNISGISVFYEYDDFGRCIGKSSSNFDLSFDYNNIGLISGVYEKSDSTSITIDYDAFGRETQRTLSNGVSIHSDYNSKGQKTLVYAKEPYGLIISAEVTLYDKSGKKQLISDKDGNITRFSYDSFGRLASVEYPYTQQILDKAKREAVECGFYLKDENPEGANFTISWEDYEGVQKLLKKTGTGGSLSRSQKCWKESFTYTENGNIASVENPFGKILYKYDSENRLIQKHGVQTNNGGIKFKWDKNGNLLQYVSALEHMDFVYGNYNRPKYIKHEDYETGEVKEAFYSYDALGRRVSEQVLGEENHRFIYDGLSSSILIDTPVFGNNISVMNYSSETINEQEDENRSVDLSAYSEFQEYRTPDEHRVLEISTPSADLKFESRPCTSVIINGLPSAYIYTDNSYTTGRSTEFLLMNSSNTSITAVIDKYGNCMGINNYDVWGLPVTDYQATSKNLSYSNSKNLLRINGNIMDLGNRDYIPSLKTFISKDPAKDGFNWFAYCSGDPVNYFDVAGLEKKSLSPFQQARYNGEIATLGCFDSERYKETGTSAGVHHSYDCADTSGVADAIGSSATGAASPSVRGEQFAKANNEGDYQKAKEVINSWNFFDSKTNPDESFRKTVDGYSKGDSTARNETYEKLSNPENIGPGTVLVWSNPNHVPGQNWIGHTLTVIARRFDANGKVIGIAYIEGHTGGDKTEIGYMSFKKGWENDYTYNLDAWAGNFEGAFEIESTTATCSQ